MHRTMDPPDPGAGWLGCWAHRVREGPEAAVTHRHPLSRTCPAETRLGCGQGGEGDRPFSNVLKEPHAELKEFPNPLSWEIVFLHEKPVFGAGGVSPAKLPKRGWRLQNDRGGSTDRLLGITVDQRFSAQRGGGAYSRTHSSYQQEGRAPKSPSRRSFPSASSQLPLGTQMLQTQEKEIKENPPRPQDLDPGTRFLHLFVLSLEMGLHILGYLGLWMLTFSSCWGTSTLFHHTPALGKGSSG